MATETVVFFYAQEKAASRCHPWQKVQFSLREELWHDRVLVAAGIPEYDYKTKRWKKEKLCRKLYTTLAPVLKGSPETAVFLYHRSLERQEDLQEALESCFPVKQNTPEDITELLLQEYCSYDALVFLDGTEQERKPEGNAEFLKKSCAHVNYLAVVTTNEEAYEEVFEQLNEEYGLAPVAVPSLENVKMTPQCRVLTAAVEPINKKTGKNLMQGCTYLDLLSSEKSRKVLEARRKDVRYVSFSKLVEKKLIHS